MKKAIVLNANKPNSRLIQIVPDRRSYQKIIHGFLYVTLLLKLTIFIGTIVCEWKRWIAKLVELPENVESNDSGNASANASSKKGQYVECHNRQ